ncbi:Alpha/beta hydrolase [uncultured Gammaproteobacteria bacterium]
MTGPSLETRNLEFRNLEFLDRPEAGRVLFHPRPDGYMPAQGPFTRAVRVAVAPGIELGGLAFIVDSQAPLILYFHGNGELASEYDDIAELYRRLDISLLVIDFRGYGRSGGHPNATTLVTDADAVLTQVPTLLSGLGLTPKAWFVMGRSLGSAAAIEIAARGGRPSGHGLAGLIVESGFALSLALVTRLGGRLPPEADEQRDGFGNVEKIASVTLPTLVLHGAEDWIIPATEGEMLFHRSGARDKHLLIIPGAGHNDLMFVGRKEYFDAIYAFVRLYGG